MTPAEEQSPDQEPSMDDILASIRRIMLDEQARLRETGGSEASAAPAIGFVMPEVPADSAAESGAVLVLDESMVVAGVQPHAVPLTLDAAELPAAVPVTVVAAGVEPAIDHALPVSLEPEPVREATVTGAATPAVITGMTPGAVEAIIAPAAAAAATASVEALLHRLQAERSALLQPVSTSTAASVSLEEFVRGELRPLLKSWLDENLPTLVERLVRAELARLTVRHGV